MPHYPPLLATLLAVCVSTTVHAETPAVTIRGAGAAPCSVVLDVFRQPASVSDRPLYLQWTSGFATSVAMSNKIVDVVPLNDNTMTLVDMALLICQEPIGADMRWQQATLNAIERLRPYWARSPATVSLTNSGTTVQLYTDAVTPLQQALLKRGFLSGNADGVFGNGTGAAVSAAHQKLNTSPSPIPTGILFYALTAPERGLE